MADRVQTLGIETRPMLIEVSGVHNVYRTGKLEYPALRGVDLAIEAAVLALLVLIAPLRRAVHLKPGEAIRYG
ncbi:MAG: hypothetical protein ACHQTF_11430 [Gemmatimonadales bacterium]